MDARNHKASRARCDGDGSHHTNPFICLCFTQAAKAAAAVIVFEAADKDAEIAALRAVREHVTSRGPFFFWSPGPVLSLPTATVEVAS